jgi:RHH-type proline utilization regulon transcriptional repressor/proline dehydrogenase/delta 1-pyrroline-5-carboxylate dehydrogenase
MLGEGARTARDADRYLAAYENALLIIGQSAANKGPINGHGLSVKLSALHPRYEFTQRDRIMTELVPRVLQLAVKARQLDIGLTIDAEEADRLDLSLDVIEAVFKDPQLQGWNGFGVAIQSYLKTGADVVDWTINLARRYNRQLMVRLVKGAYWDSEIKHSQVEGFSNYPVFTRKSSTDLSYLVCAQKLLDSRGIVFPQFATHNAVTVAAILAMAEAPSVTGSKEFEFQRLHGMGDVLYDEVLESAQARCRIYAPVGIHQDLLAYLVRRILENGANSSFVNNIVDKSVPIEDLLIDPIDETIASSPKLNPAIPLPHLLYQGYRANSRGLDITDPKELEPLLEEVSRWQPVHMAKSDTKTTTVYNPANTREIVGAYNDSDAGELSEKLKIVANGCADWSETPVAARASCLDKLAQLLHDNRNQLIAFCAKEAGKTFSDGIAEVREAIDFCHYYAEQARKLSRNTGNDVSDDLAPVANYIAESPPLGVVLCISPWNFPLAIFLGQVSAALVAGNTVLAKPAEQSSLIALRIAELIAMAGIPETAFQLVTGPGKRLGEKLVPDVRIAGIMFTGSTETATWISRQLAKRPDGPVPLIAETGGQNAMIVDSTALPEAVVDDVISSGFLSAGQRCSALRVLYLQEEIADKVISMIKGAMQEMSIGDPSRLCTDVGPVIDKRALRVLADHHQRMQDEATLLYQCPLGRENQDGHFFAPALYELSDITVLSREVFGPAVHVVRYKSENLENVIDAVNGTGYGLTLGIHSRIESKAEYISRRIKVGNIYINRNMVGAVVGVQPFGGCGLSGTGPKAGGPHYLLRLTGSPVQTAGQVDDTAKKEWLKKAAQRRLKDLKPGNELNLNVNRLIEIAATATPLPVSDRLGILGEFLESSRSWLDSMDDVFNTDAKLSAQVELSIKQMVNLSEQPTLLPGPTGESNELIWEPRGVVTCICRGSPDTWLRSVCVGLLTGNSLIIVHDQENERLIIQLVRRLLEAGVAEAAVQPLCLRAWERLPSVVLHAGIRLVAVPNREFRSLGCMLAQRSGELISLQAESECSAYLHRFMREKTITIDTTAAGGNASLMMAAADPTKHFPE